MDSNDESALKVVFINKTNNEMPVDFTVLSSYDFETANVYSFDSTHSDITLSDETISITDNGFTFNAAPLSVSLLEFKSEEIFDDGEDLDDEINRDSSTKTQASSSSTVEHEHVEITAQTKRTSDDEPEQDVQTSISVVGTDDFGETITEIVTSIAGSETETIDKEPTGKTVPKAIKIVGIVLTASVAAGVVFVLLDNGESKNKKSPKGKNTKK